MLAGPPCLLAGWRRDRGANSLPRLWIKRARSLRARWSLSACADNNNGASSNDGVRAVLELMMGQGVYALCLVLIDVGVTFERLDVKVAVVGVFQLRGLMRIFEIDGSESVDLDANRYE